MSAAGCGDPAGARALWNPGGAGGVGSVEVPHKAGDPARGGGELVESDRPPPALLGRGRISSYLSREHSLCFSMEVLGGDCFRCGRGVSGKSWPH